MRPFLLLEVLIALSLVMSLILPLTSRTSQIYKTDRDQARKIDAAKKANLIFYNIKKNITEDHPWETHRQKKTHILPEGSYTISVARPEKENNKTFRLLKIEMKIDGEEYEYRLFVIKEKVSS